MITFAKRRARNMILTVAVALVVTFLAIVLKESLRPAAIYTGFVLLAMLVGLTMLNARKKLPFLPLATAATWLQIHIYGGLLSILVFLLHIDFRYPTGRLETLLTILFAIVTVSGIIGLLFTRRFPRKINDFGEGVVFERIPAISNRLLSKVEGIVRDAEVETGSSAIGDFYLTELAAYFRCPPRLAILVGDPLRYERRILGRLAEFSRYLNEKESEIVGRIRECITVKRNLDYQRSALWLLKAWLFIHIPFTYGLIIAAFLHAWVALSYGGSH